jgi:hypothetical protein
MCISWPDIGLYGTKYCILFGVMIYKNKLASGWKLGCNSLLFLYGTNFL